LFDVGENTILPDHCVAALLCVNLSAAERTQPMPEMALCAWRSATMTGAALAGFRPL